MAKFLDYSVRERLAIAAGKRVKKDEWRIVIKTRQRIARRDRTTKRFADSGTGAFRQLYIAFHRMRPPIDLGDAMVKPARAFAPIAHSVYFSCPADFCDQRATQQSLEIERQIGPQHVGCLPPPHQIPCRTETAEFAAGKDVNVIDIGIAAEQWREFRIDHPGDFSTGMNIAHQRHCRESVDDVAERTRLNDQNRFQICQK